MRKRQRVSQTILLVSFILFPITYYYMSPYLSLDGAFRGVLTGAAIVFAAQFVIWVPWVALLVFAFLQAGGIRSVDFLYMTEHGIPCRVSRRSSCFSRSWRSLWRSR